MKNIRRVIFLLLTVISFTEATAQQNILRGRIIDPVENMTVVGANVIEYDSENRVVNGAISDVNGDFVLEMRDPSHVVKISMIGYETKEITPDFSKPMRIELNPSTIEVDEVVVTAERKSNSNLINVDDRDNASSTVKVDLMEMRDAGVVSAADALQGKVTGLDIISSSGDPGSGSQLVIRGLSGMGNNDPLIVIDGIPQAKASSYNTDIELSSADQEDISNLVNLALQDIKSIEVLKDAASTAQFGSRGADGVLLIETHKGRLGKVQFDYQYKNSINFQPPTIPMLNGDEYVMLQLEEWHNSEGVFDLSQYPEIAYDRDYVDFYNYSANTDWIGAVTQDAVTHDHYLSLNGGGEKTRYFASFGYVDEGGTTINTGSQRFSTRINLDYFLSRRFIFTVEFAYTNNRVDNNLRLENRNVREMAYIKAPNMSIWEYDAYGRKTGDYFVPINSYQGSGSAYWNPVAVSELGKNDEVRNNLVNTFRIRYNINDWLTFREAVSFQLNGSKAENYMPYNALGTNWLAWTVNKAEESNNLSRDIRTETQLAFSSPFENEVHDISGVLTWITQNNASEWMNLQSNKGPSTDIQDPAIGGQINWIGNGSGETRSLGALANVNYKLLDRYMVQGILRADAHSSFGINHRWGLFKGLSTAWRFSSEPFLAGLAWLGESKVRFSYGVSGRQPGDSYARFATYNTIGNNYITNPTLGPTSIQLNNLQWESITSFNLGLELSLFNEKLFLEGDVYDKLTEDLLFGGPEEWQWYKIPTSSGYTGLKYFNGGEMRNQGWELMANYTPVRTDNWRWSINFNTSRNVNSFTKLPDNFNPEQSTAIGNGDYPKRVTEGEPIGSFFGFRYQGVYSSDADAVARDAEGNILYDNEGAPIPMTYGTYTFRGGDAKYEDINHDGKIDLNDVVYIGDSNPDFIGGFGTSLKYKNFDFSMSFHYRYGFDIINYVALETQGMLNRNNQSKAVLSRWRVQDQDEEGMLPRAYMNHPANNLGSDRYVEEGDYLRLNNVKLGYRLNQSLVERMNLRTVTLSVTARKLYTFTNYSGQDPEVGQDASDPFWIGVDRANTPPPRVLTFSVMVGF
ncbi:MAG: SusC/RagA family TonB-linked outer membrane protein [Bacteroidota bacterium]